MKALLAKDSMWYLFFLAAGIAASFAVLIDEGFYDAWVEPEEDLYAQTSVLYWIAATAMGVVLAIREEVYRTRDYLWHRPLSRWQIFQARNVGSLLTLALIVLVPFVVHYLYYAATHEDAALMDGSRLWYYFAIGTIVFPCYAAGYFAGSFSRRYHVALLLAGLPSILSGYLVIGTNLPLHEPWVTQPLLLIVTNIAVTAAILWACYWNECQGHDLDLPVSPQRAVLSGMVALITGSTLATMGIGAIQEVQQGGLRRQYPQVVKLANQDRYALAKLDLEGRNYVWRLYDKDHRALPATPGQTEFEGHSAVQRVYASSPHLDQDLDNRFDRWRRHRTHFRGVPWDLVGGVPGMARCYLDRASGELLWIRRSDRRGQRVGFKKVLIKPDGSRFSKHARSAIDYTWARFTAIGDPADGSLWILDTANRDATLQRLEIPDNDQFVASVEHRVLDRLLRDRKLELSELDEAVLRTISSGNPMQHNHPFVIRGKKHYWVWNTKELRKLPDAVAASLRNESSRSRSRRRHPPARLKNFDPIHRDVEVLDANGKTVFTHTFQPTTLAERFQAGVLWGTSLLRLPVLQVPQWLGSQPHSRFDPEGFRDALLAGRKRPVLLTLNILLGLGLAWRCWQRLTRLGAEPSRRMFWSLAVVLCGAVGFLAYRLVEDQRAWRFAAVPEPQQESEPHELLIRSA